LDIEGKYEKLIKQVIELEGESIDVDARDVFDHDHELYSKMVRYPLEVLAIFDMVLMNMVTRMNPMFEKHVQTRIFNLKSSTSMRNLNPSGEFLFSEIIVIQFNFVRLIVSN
jgi:DNA replication licensing factor MCM4